MPNFEEFSRTTARAGRGDTMFTLQARGLLSFNQAAFAALGEPDAVALLYDGADHVVALRKVDRAHANACPVRKQQNTQSYLVGAQAFTAYYSIPTPRARRFAGVDYGDGIWGFALDQGEPVQNRRGAQEPGIAITDRWRYTTDGLEVPGLMRITDKAFSHPGYALSYPDRPPSLRIGTLVACDPLGPTPPISEVRARFLAFLTEYRVLDLVSMLTDIEQAARWTAMAGHGRLLLEAAMMTDNQEKAPVASAMLILPEAGKSRFGSDPQRAEFVLHIERRTNEGTVAPALPLEQWQDRFTRAIAVPEALARFLSHDLGLATPAEPPAQFGIWLNSQRGITDLVDVGNLKALPGSAHANWFLGYAVGDPAGLDGPQIARELIEQMCEFTLHLDGWDRTLPRTDATSERST